MSAICCELHDDSWVTCPRLSARWSEVLFLTHDSQITLCVCISQHLAFADAMKMFITHRCSTPLLILSLESIKLIMTHVKITVTSSQKLITHDFGIRAFFVYVYPMPEVEQLCVCIWPNVTFSVHQSDRQCRSVGWKGTRAWRRPCPSTAGRMVVLHPSSTCGGERAEDQFLPPLHRVSVMSYCDNRPRSGSGAVRFLLP